MKNKKIIILTLIISILIMSIGYASFATDLKINGTTQIDGEWDIKITNIEATSICNKCDAGTPNYTDTTANFNAKLTKPGDSITYQITIKNNGNIDAKLDKVTITDDKNEAIIYSTTEPAKILNAGESTTYLVTTIYDKNTNKVPENTTKNFTSTIKYSQN